MDTHNFRDGRGKLDKGKLDSHNFRDGAASRRRQTQRGALTWRYAVGVRVERCSRVLAPDGRALALWSPRHFSSDLAGFASARHFGQGSCSANAAQPELTHRSGFLDEAFDFADRAAES